jgi:hypothetical protein
MGLFGGIAHQGAQGALLQAGFSAAEIKAAVPRGFESDDGCNRCAADNQAAGSALEFIEEYAKIKTYKIEFPKEFAFTPQVLLWLDNYIDSPFFVNKKHIIVMKEKAAFELYLLSGDVRKLGHNRAMSKRLSQESTPE